MEVCVIYGKNTYTKKEMAKAILFGNAYLDQFVKSFKVGETQFYQKVK